MTTAVAAMTLADTVAKRDLHGRYRLRPHIQSCAEELSLTVPEARALATQDPSGTNLERRDPATRQPDHEPPD